MGKYFNGKQFDYVEQGNEELTYDFVKRTIIRDNRANRRAYYRSIILVIHRSWNITRERIISIMKKTTKKQTRTIKWRNLANIVNRLITRVFLAGRNLGKKLYRFLDEV